MDLIRLSIFELPDNNSRIAYSSALRANIRKAHPTHIQSHMWLQHIRGPHTTHCGHGVTTDLTQYTCATHEAR